MGGFGPPEPQLGGHVTNARVNDYHAKGTGQAVHRSPEAAASGDRISKAPPGGVKQTICQVYKTNDQLCGNLLKSDREITENTCWSHLGARTKAGQKEMADATE